MFLKDKVSISKRSFTDEGYLVVKDAKIARTGIQPYLAMEMGDMFSDKEPTTLIKVYRPEEEVFKQESVDSFKNKPVTNDHPSDAVNVENFKDLAVGFSSDNVRREGNHLVADLTITNLLAVKDVQAGKRELSNGYRSSITREEGITPSGEHYDAVQRDIKGNHIAIVDNARCGSSCALGDSKPLSKKEGNIMQVIIDGVPYEIADETAAAAVKNYIAKQETINDSASKAVTKSQATHDAAIVLLNDEKADLEKQLADAKANEMTPERLDKAMESRKVIVDHAVSVITNFDSKGLTCMEIKRKVLVAKLGDSADAEKLKDDAYVDASFDTMAAIGVFSKDKSSGKSTSQVLIDSAKKDGETEDEEEEVTDSVLARRRKIARNVVATQFPVGAATTDAKNFNDAVDAEMVKRFGKKNA